jgi:hypothetical protein
MTENNAAQPGLTDDEIEALAKKHIAPHADRLDAIMKNPVPYQQTEQFRRVKALIADVLSKLRAEGVQAGDERAAFLLEEALGYIRSFAIPGKTAEDMTAIAQAGMRRFTAALASAPVAEPYDSEKRCRAYYDSDLRPFAADGVTYDVWKAVWHAAQFDRAMHPNSSKPRPHSAPVAGDAVAIPLRPLTEDERAAIEFYTLNPTAAVRDLDKRLSGEPAPQASEAVRIVFPAHLRRMWSGGEVQAWLDEHQGITPPKASASGRMKRYRKWQADQTQANKVGGDCSKGAGEASSPVAGVPHTALQLEDLSRQVERDIHRFGTNVHVGVPAGVLRSMLHTLHAPVAGEARKMLADEEALDGVAEWLNQHDLTVNVGAAIEPARDVHIESSAGWLLRLLTALNSAPQASEAVAELPEPVNGEARAWSFAAPGPMADEVRNAALEEAASMCESWMMERPRVSAEAVANQTMERMARYIRALNTQADKDGGDCAKGAVDEREEFEKWAVGILGDNPTWRESGPCELAWQAWQARTPTPSVVKQSLTATQTGEKGESDA